MHKRWESRLLLWTAQVSTIWMVVGLVLKYINWDLTESIATAFSVFNLSSYPSLFIAILMVLLTSGLLRGNRGALVFYLLGFQVPSLLIGIAYLLIVVFDPEETLDVFSLLVLISTAASVLFLVAGWRARDEFPARVEGSWVKALVVLGGGIAVSFSIVLSLLVVYYHKPIDLSAVWAMYTALGVSPNQPPFAAGIHAPHYLKVLGSVLSSAAIFLALAVMMRSRKFYRASSEDHLLLRKLLLSPPSSDSLAYFATRDDRNLVVSPNGAAAISYRVIDGVCLAAGDPIGDPACWLAAMSAWRTEARKNGWILGVASASEKGARAYAEMGLRVIPLGDEAIIDTEHFRLKDLPAVRKELAGPRKAGYTVKVVRQEQLTAEEAAHYAEVAQQWRRGDERGFTMASGRVGDPRDRRTVLVAAHDSTGEPMGVLTLVPWGRNGLSLDVMRRNPKALGGVTELMVAALAAEAPNLGVSRFSLNFVTFRESLDRGMAVGASPWERLLFKLLVTSSRWWQIQSLYQSNVKYEPSWQARYLCIEHGFHTPRVLIAFASAEGFLPGFNPSLEPLGDPAAIAAVEAEALTPKVLPPHRSAQQKARLCKLDALEHSGMRAYPPAVPRGEDSLTGRIWFIRNHGQVLFADVVEGERRTQLLIDATTPDALASFKRLVSRGDIISATGVMGQSRNGTPSLLVQSWTMAAKSLVPMPRQASRNPHTRAKYRHIDFTMNSQARSIFSARSRAITAVRSVLVSQGYLEAETPILQTIHGGANARPFRTHIRAYDQALTLRIAPELYLKRLVVGGFERVFEMGRNFRNEGVDATHNPEFTSLEAYQAYGNWDTMRELTENIIRSAAIAVHGSPQVTTASGEVLDLSGSWPVVPVYEAVSRAVGETISPSGSLADYAHIAQRYEIEAATVGDLVNELYDELVEPTTVFPTFYAGFPVETSPLTMADPDEPRIAQRWDLVACGMELGTAYTELADPIEQRARLTDQSLRAAGGDAEAMELDENFLQALEFGMPPTGGLGIGIDRLVMFLTGQNIREVLAFPFVKPDSTN